MDIEGDLLLAFAIDFVAVSILAFLIYFPRHQRRDLVLAFLGVNAGLFAVAELVADKEVNIALGLGLFALLSVVRLRSAEIAQEDIGYYFIALVLGLINGVAHEGEWARIVTLDLILLLVTFIADHPRILGRRFQQVVTLDDVYADERALRADVERRLGGTVMKVVVLRTDFVHKQTVVDVRMRLPEPTGPINRHGHHHDHHPHHDGQHAGEQPEAVIGLDEAPVEHQPGVRDLPPEID